MNRPSQMIADLVDLGAAMTHDDSLPADERLQRDQQIGAGLAEVTPIRRLRSWLDERRHSPPFTNDSPGFETGIQTATGTRFVGTLLVVVGLILGWGCAVAVFGYDGSTPVNVVHVIGLFVILQFVLLIGFILLALPGRIARWVPGLTGLQSILRGLSPGFFLPLLARLLPHQYRIAVQGLNDRLQLNRKLYGQVANWVALEWSQRFAVAFHAGALASVLILTVFSDLAFGWSTTINLAADGFHRITSWLSLPWSWWFATAVPDQTLVEATQYFRLDTGSGQTNQMSTQASVRAKWWPFILMCLVVYSLIPRILTWWYARYRLRQTIQSALLNHPGVRELNQRLQPVRVSTRAIERSETQREHNEIPVEQPDKTLSGNAVVIDWTHAIGDIHNASRLVDETLNLSQVQFMSVGGNNTLDEDTATLASVKPDNDTTVVFIVRAWETPTLDILDTLGDLRQSIDETTTICVLVMDNTDSKSRGDFKVWQQTLGRLSDPWLRAVQVDLESKGDES